MDFGGLAKQAMEMQKKMAEMQEKVAQRIVDGIAGGGMVKAQVNGKQELLSIKVDKEVIDPDDPEMLEDLVIAAVNQALKKSQEMVQEEMSKVTGGLNIPGLF